MICENMEKCLFIVLQILCVVYFAAGDVKQECIASRNYDGNSDGYGGYGDTDPGEYREPDEYERPGHGSRMYPTTGTLTCSGYEGGSIVVKKVTWGVGMYPGTCQADHYCGEESDDGDVIAGKCDGQSTCTVDLRNPSYLKCGRTSSYMLVEYECINSWATFDACKNASTVSREPSVYLTSPNYLSPRAPPPARGTKMCECILRSRDSADLYMEYLQTRLSSDQQSCPYEYVMVQNKENITKATVDHELEVCGNRKLAGRWFRGTLRIILAAGGAMQKRGLLAKITADNLGQPPRIDVECGTVPTDVRLQTRPVLRETVDPSVTRSRINPAPYGPPAAGHPYPPPGPNPGPYPGPYPGAPRGPYMDRPSYSDDGYDAEDAHERYNRYYPPPAGHQPPWTQPQLPPQPHPQPPPGPMRERTNIPDLRPPRMYPGPPQRNPTPPGGGFQPDISRLKIRLPADKPTNIPPARAQPRLPFAAEPKPVNTEVKKPTKRKAVNKKKPGARGSKPPHLSDRRTPQKKGTGRIVDNQDPSIEQTPVEQKTGNGGLVAVVFGTIGSVLILGSVAILALHNYRKRQRIKREEAEYAEYAYSGGSRSSYGRGLPKEAGVANKDESVYATVKEVDMYKASVNPGDSDTAHAQHIAAQDQEDDIDKAYAEVSENFRASRFVYEGPAVHDVASVTQDDIAVIEVHQPFDGRPEVWHKEHQHDTDCLREFGYTTAGREGDEVLYCKSCEIRRPPRRRDRASSGYDNNVSVRKHMPYSAANETQ